VRRRENVGSATTPPDTAPTPNAGASADAPIVPRRTAKSDIRRHICPTSRCSGRRFAPPLNGEALGQQETYVDEAHCNHAKIRDVVD